MLDKCAACNRRPCYARGLCEACYQYAYRHGTLDSYPYYQAKGRREYDHARYLRRKGQRGGLQQ